MLREKSKIKFDSIGVTLMGLSSLHATYGPGGYWYILVVIETTPTCLDLGVRKGLCLNYVKVYASMFIQRVWRWPNNNPAFCKHWPTLRHITAAIVTRVTISTPVARKATTHITRYIGPIVK